MAGWLKVLDQNLVNVASGVAGLDASGFVAHEQGGLEANVSAYSGLVKISGGTTSAITDNSTNWDTAYTHSQVSTGNPHSINPNDLDALSATWDLGGTYAIQSSFTPASANDLTNKSYVDGVAAGLDPKDSVTVVSTSNLTLSGEQTIDGVLTSTSRILVAGQTTPSQNGIYVTASGAWARSSDMAAGSDAAGNYCFIEQGTTYADTGWVCTSNKGSAVVGTNDLSFSQFYGPGAYTGATNEITITGTEIGISSNYAGNSNITTLGTVTTGTWSATEIGPTKGGTGLTTFSSGNILYASGADTWAAAAPGATSGVQAYSANLDTYVSNPLTAGELGQLQNIDSVTITNGQWAYVGNMDQDVTSTSNVAFGDVVQTGDHVITPTTIAIATGACTITRSRHYVAAEAGTADDLDTISGGQTGQMLYLTADPTGPDTITLKHGTGNITTSSAGDIAMGSDDVIVLSYDGTNWLVTDWSGTVTAHAMGGSSHTADTNTNVSSKISDLSGLIVGTTDTQTLTNKTLTSPIVGTQITLDQTTADYTITWADPAAGRALSINDPGAAAAFVFDVATQTLTNKTLTSPDINGGTVDAITSLTPGGNWDFGTTYTSVGRYLIKSTTTAGRPGSPGNYELNWTTDGSVTTTTGPGLYVYSPV